VSEPLLDVRAIAQWDIVAPLRLLALAAVRPHVKSHDEAESCAMVASELLENGVRYGHWARSPDQRIHLRIAPREGGLVVEVASPALAGSDDLVALQSHIARFASLGSRKEAYEGRIRELLESNTPPARSRMGLARIVAEAGGDLRARLDEASILHVTAFLAPEASP
jgi:hypothetical protein